MEFDVHLAPIPVSSERSPCDNRCQEAMMERGNVMQTAQSGTSEIAIFSRVLERDQATLAEAAAQSILNLGFTQGD
jgi:hypothetical protein